MSEVRSVENVITPNDDVAGAVLALRKSRDSTKSGAVEEVKPVFVLTTELNTLDGQECSTYTFTTENCTQEQLHMFRCHLANLLVLVGKVPS